MNFKISTQNGFVTEVIFSQEKFQPQNQLESKTLEEIEEYLHGKRKSFDLPLKLEGTEFQKLVWNELEKIPYGQTRSYSEIASAIGNPKAIRAVGSACSKNRICIIIPCHRVTAKNGIGGFSAGIEIKKYLLNLEKIFGGTSMQNFLELAHARYSCRKFSSRPVEKEKLDQIIEAALISPTAVNAQPEHLFILRGEENAKKVSETTRFTFDAKTFIVLGIKQSTAWIRKFDQKCFGDIDGGIVAASILFATKDLGLDSTYVGYFDPDKMKELFPEMQDYDLVGLFPIGYAAEDSKPSPIHSKKNPRESMVTEI